MMRAKTRQEIANEFGINRKTLYRWLKHENVQLKNRLITPDEQSLIYNMFGFPESLVFKKIKQDPNKGHFAS